MPVTLQYVDQARWEAEEQVRIDLVRIYEDAPQERMPTPTVLPFIEQHLKEQQFFACAHFTGKRDFGNALVLGQHGADATIALYHVKYTVGQACFSEDFGKLKRR